MGEGNGNTDRTGSLHRTEITDGVNGNTDRTGSLHRTEITDGGNGNTPACCRQGSYRNVTSDGDYR